VEGYAREEERREGERTRGKASPKILKIDPGRLIL